MPFYSLSNWTCFRGRVTVFASISRRDIENIQIPLPLLEIQKKIVAEIEAERALIDSSRELIKRMEKKIQATLARIWGKE